MAAMISAMKACDMWWQGWSYLLFLKHDQLIDSILQRRETIKKQFSSKIDTKAETRFSCSNTKCEKFIWYIQFKINTCKMNWICKKLGIVYLPPTIDSSCCNRFPNSDDLLWMVYYWRKKNGRSQVQDHMWNIYAWLPIIPRLCRFATPSFNAAEKMRLWWRTWVWPLQNHPFMVVNVETTWGGDNRGWIDHTPFHNPPFKRRR